MTNHIALTIVSSVAQGRGSWMNIMDAIIERGLVPSNWLAVHHELQQLVNDKFIVRTNSIHEEVYTLVQACKTVSVPSVSTTSAVAIKRGTAIQHPARKQPMIVKEVTARGSVIVAASGGGQYRLKMSEAQRYAVRS